MSFTGSLATKRKAELVDIAATLGLPAAAEARMAELREAIQARLDADDALRDDPVFRGLYSQRRRPTRAESESDTPAFGTPDVKAAVAYVAARGRKSVTRALETVQAADIPLPDSPAAAIRAVTDATSSATVALVPRKVDSHTLIVRAQNTKNQLVKYAHAHNKRIERYVANVQTHLSTPNAIIQGSLAVEMIMLFRHVVQFYNHTIFFPPSSNDGPLAALVHAIFFWVPEMSMTISLPEAHSLAPSTDLWPALITWFFATVLPPFALSNIVSFVPQKNARRPHPTRAHPASTSAAPTFDPLTFAFFRLAALVLPLTSAAPSALADTLKLSGDAQGRVLFGALTAALILAERLVK
ncbi:hypothetical protein Q5752_006996 [Cryptotrichosporon argae]